MKKLFLIPLTIVMMASMILYGCAQPSPAPSPAPSPSPSPAPSPSPSPAPAAPIKILFANSDPPPPTGVYSGTWVAYFDELKRRTNGRIETEISWGSALATMPEFYDSTARGLCDMAWQMLGVTAPGRFPMSEIMGLPWDIADSAISTKCEVELYQKGYFDGQFPEVQLCGITTGTADYMFTVDKPITTLEDIKGLKIMGQSDVHTDRNTALGAVPTILPFPEIYMALQKKIIDGTSISAGVIRMLNAYDTIKYATLPAFGTVTSVMVMNKDSWNSLPPDIQKIIEEMMPEWSVKFAEDGQVFADGAMEEFVAQGGQVLNWTPEALDEIDVRFAPIWEKWIADREAKGLPAKQAVDEFWACMKASGIERPGYGYTPGQ